MKITKYAYLTIRTRTGGRHGFWDKETMTRVSSARALSRAADMVEHDYNISSITIYCGNVTCEWSK